MIQKHLATRYSRILPTLYLLCPSTRRPLSSSHGNPVPKYQTFHNRERPFPLFYGQSLPSYQIAYETWGTLNKDKSNVVLIHTGLSASSHVKSHPGNMERGWWEDMMGPGKALNTEKFFFICANVLGGCYGSTGPSSMIPNTGDDGAPTKAYGTTFPIVSIFDMVRTQFKLLDSLGIHRLHCSLGSSMGGMQSIAAAALFPQRVGRVISISAAAKSHPYSIALRYCQRRVIMSDPAWKSGQYYGKVDDAPIKGMQLAREIATISYRSGPEWEERFGQKRISEGCLPSLNEDFLIESYIKRQGDKLSMTYDPNSLLYLSRAMDLFDMSDVFSFLEFMEKTDNDLNQKIAHHSCPANKKKGVTEQSIEDSFIRAFSRITMPTLILGVQSDILFPITQQRELHEALVTSGNKQVAYYELDSKYGHDTFLVDLMNVGTVLRGHLECGSGMTS